MNPRNYWEGEVCHYCPAPAASLDHIIPRALGGRNNLDNLVPACLPCNGRKADSLPTCDCPKCLVALTEYQEELALRALWGTPAPLVNPVIPLPQAEQFRDATWNSAL